MIFTRNYMQTSNSPGLSRRTLLTGLAATPVAALALPRGALALSANESTRLVSAAVDDINRVINSGRSEGAMLSDFRRLFIKYSDYAGIALLSLGADARRATAAQKKAYIDAYTGYISRKYGRRFREFIGGRIEVQGARQVKSSIEVETVARLRGQAPFDVTFVVSDRTGSHKFYNLYIADVNMVLTERAEIGAMLDRRGGNIDALIQDLKRA